MSRGDAPGLQTWGTGALPAGHVQSSAGRSRSVPALSLLVTALLVALTVLARAVPELPLVVVLLVFLPQWFWMLPSAALALVSVRRGMVRLAVLNLAAALLAALFLGGLELGGLRGAEARAGGGTVRVLTWNVRNEQGEVDAVRREIVRHAPDIVCLQEAQGAAFVGLLPGYYRARMGGARTFSRFPIIRAVEFSPSGVECGPVLICQCQTPHGTLTVINAHVAICGVPHGPREVIPYALRSGMLRAAQARVLHDLVPSAGPVVMAVDLNMAARSAGPRLLGQKLTDAFASTRCGFGFTWMLGDRLPYCRIDHILTGNGAHPISCRVGSNYPSDHRPVVAEVALP